MRWARCIGGGLGILLGPGLLGWGCGGDGATESSSAAPLGEVADCAVPTMDALFGEPGAVLPTGELPQAGACVAREHDVLIVLGCPTRDDGSPAVCQESRVELALRLSAAGYGARFITTGGAVQNQWVEADTLASLLLAQGVASDAIWTEPLAEHTDENLYYSSLIMSAQGWTSAVVVSDAAGHLVNTAVCDSNCCVRLGRLTIFDFPTAGGPVRAGHYALFPHGQDIGAEECAVIEDDTKLMCLALDGRRACADDFQL